MRYSENSEANEDKKIQNGEREIVTATQLHLFLGSDNTEAEAWEMLLDILNSQYPLDDAVNDIKEHYKQELEL